MEVKMVQINAELHATIMLSTSLTRFCKLKKMSKQRNR